MEPFKASSRVRRLLQTTKIHILARRVDELDFALAKGWVLQRTFDRARTELDKQ